MLNGTTKNCAANLEKSLQKQTVGTSSWHIAPT
jgi:hypothetical protein